MFSLEDIQVTGTMCLRDVLTGLFQLGVCQKETMTKALQTWQGLVECLLPSDSLAQRVYQGDSAEA